MILNANGGGGLRPYQAWREVDMAIFDTLPPEVRQAMNTATFKYPAAEFRAILARVPPAQVAAFVPTMDRNILAKEASHARA